MKRMKPLSSLLILAVGIAIGWGLAVTFQAGDMNSKVLYKSEIQPNPSTIASNTQPITTQPEVDKKGEKKTTDTKSNSLEENFWNAFNDNDFDNARTIVEEMNRVVKDGQPYNEGLTRILVKTREYQQAKTALEHCLKIYPKSKSCLVDMVDVEMEIGTRDQQLKAAEQCLSSYPGHPQCLNDLAIIKMHEGKYSEAVEIYEKLIATNGSFGFRFKLEMLDAQLGFALEGAGRFADAAEKFSSACRLNWPGSCAALENLKGRY